MQAPGYSVLDDPVLARLQQELPTSIVGGYPVLEDSSLAWPGASLFMLGKAALLALEPIVCACTGLLAIGGLMAACDLLSCRLHPLFTVEPTMQACYAQPSAKIEPVPHARVKWSACRRAGGGTVRR